jgi:hypothetical protein
MDALLPDDPALVSDGWLQVLLLPDADHRDTAIALPVTCVRSTSGSEESPPGGSEEFGRLILGIGGRNPDGSRYLLTVGEAIGLIESGRFAFYVGGADSPPVWLEVVRPRGGAPYLRTEADDTSRNNLDNLPECPVTP